MDKNDKELIEPIEFLKVEKLSDDMYTLGPNVVLRFNVHLARNANNTRYHFHKEFEYSTNIKDYDSLVTIKRSFDYYMSLENCQKDSNGNKVFIRIGPSEYIYFKKALEEAVAWFTDIKYDKLFVYDSGKLTLLQPIPEFVMNKLPMGKYIRLEPVVIDKGMANADKEPGVRIELGSDSNFIDINVDKLMGLYYLVSTFNMYQAAISLVNYLGRPPLGTSRIVMENARTVPQLKSRSGTSGIIGRFVPADTKNDIKSLE